MLPVLLPCEPLIKEGQYFWHIELHVFKVQLVVVVLLHLEKIVQFEVQF